MPDETPPSEPSLLVAALHFLGRVILLFVTVGALLVGGATLAGFAARYSFRCEQLCHFRVQYAVLLAVAVVLFTVAKRGGRAFLAALLMTVNLALIVPLYFGDRAPAGYPLAGGRPTLRVVGMNVYAGNSRYEDALSFVREEKPDVIVFTEVTPAWAAALATLANDYPYSRVEAQTDSFGIAVYSRLPLANVEKVIWGGAGVPSIVADVTFEGRELSLIAMHSVAPIDPMAVEWRDEHLAAIAARAAETEKPTIVVGDLNTTSWSPCFGELLERGKLRDTRVGFGVQPSWGPRSLRRLRLPIIPLIPIDHCLVTSEFKVVDRRVGRDVGSDHRPIITDLVIDPPPTEGTADR